MSIGLAPLPLPRHTPKAIGNGVADGTIDEHNIYKERDKLASDGGLQITSKGILKRPSSHLTKGGADESTKGQSDPASGKGKARAAKARATRAQATKPPRHDERDRRVASSMSARAAPTAPTRRSPAASRDESMGALEGEGEEGEEEAASAAESSAEDICDDNPDETKDHDDDLFTSVFNRPSGAISTSPPFGLRPSRRATRATETSTRSTL